MDAYELMVNLYPMFLRKNSQSPILTILKALWVNRFLGRKLIVEIQPNLNWQLCSIKFCFNQHNPTKLNNQFKLSKPYLTYFCIKTEVLISVFFGFHTITLHSLNYWPRCIWSIIRLDLSTNKNTFKFVVISVVRVYLSPKVKLWKVIICKMTELTSFFWKHIFISWEL